MFEYKVINYVLKSGFTMNKFNPSVFEEELNKLGLEGWELVNAVPQAEGYGATKSITLFLKREK